MDWFLDDMNLYHEKVEGLKHTKLELWQHAKY